MDRAEIYMCFQCSLFLRMAVNCFLRFQQFASKLIRPRDTSQNPKTKTKNVNYVKNMTVQIQKSPTLNVR